MDEESIMDDQNQPLLESFQRKRKLQLGILSVFIAVVLLLGGLIYLVSSPDPERTVLFISIDGFRYDYLYRGLTPNLLHLMNNGVYSELQPSFPSSTFANHYTLVTGLHPEKHGIIDNRFYDPEFNQTFDYKKPISLQEKWWLAEPIWQTVEKANKSSYVYMYPGCDVNRTVKPSTYIPFSQDVVFDTKINDILHQLSKNRPKFMALYTPEVDQSGHKNGPDSSETNTVLSLIDNGIGKLIDGIRESSLQDFVDVVVVSDHGMMNLRPDAFIDYTKWPGIIDNKKSNIKISDQGIVWGAYVDTADALHDMYLNLKNTSFHDKTFNVYLREETPEHLSYSDSLRIPPLIALPNAGYYIADNQWSIRGQHGYDPMLEEMTAMFIGYGPSFESCPDNPVLPVQIGSSSSKTKKCQWDKFPNTLVHDILCTLLFDDPTKCINVNSSYK